MPRNGSGTYTPSVTFVTEAASPPIEISKLDTQMTDIATALTASIASDGQTLPSAALPMNGFRHTGAGAAQALTDYATATDVIDQDLIYYVDSGAANAYVITMATPAIAVYEEGQRFVFRAVNANTGASTLNVNSLGAIAIQTVDAAALSAGAIVSGGIYEVTYDANTTPDRFVLTSPVSAIPDGMLSANVPLLNAVNVFTASQEINVLGATLFFHDPTAPLNEKRFLIQQEPAGTGRFTTRTDVGGVGVNFIEWNRSGTTVTNLDLTATSITANGSEILTAAEIAAATAIDVSGLAATDGIYIDDAGTAKRMAFQNMGIRLLTTSLAKTFALTDANALNQLSGATARTWTIPAAATVAFKAGAVIYPASVGTAVITLDPAVGVTINSKIAQASTVSRTILAGGTGALIYLGSDAWQLCGDIG